MAIETSRVSFTERPLILDPLVRSVLALAACP
jgi:hypothetical protein